MWSALYTDLVWLKFRSKQQSYVLLAEKTLKTAACTSEKKMVVNIKTGSSLIGYEM
jgi:hypothetical protein